MQADFLATGFLKTDVSALRKMCEMLPERAFTSDEGDTGTAKEMTELFPVGVVGPNTAAGKLGRIRKLMEGSLAEYEDRYALAAAVQSILDDTTRGNGRLLGEDYHFSHLARKCGFQLWIDTRCIVPHVGPIAFPITPDKVSIPGGIPTHVLTGDHF